MQQEERLYRGGRTAAFIASDAGRLTRRWTFVAAPASETDAVIATLEPFTARWSVCRRSPRWSSTATRGFVAWLW